VAFMLEIVAMGFYCVENTFTISLEIVLVWIRKIEKKT
jgi:hypothetical protein